MLARVLTEFKVLFSPKSILGVNCPTNEVRISPTTNCSFYLPYYVQYLLAKKTPAPFLCFFLTLARPTSIFSESKTKQEFDFYCDLILFRFHRDSENFDDKIPQQMFPQPPNELISEPA